jgi:aminotransferase in exopolysaccharide biosynthesis
MSDAPPPDASDRNLQAIIDAVRGRYGAEGFIPLHAPVFGARDKEYVLDAIESTYVSSVGAYVDRFEAMMRDLTGAAHAVAVVNGTAALHMSLILAGVQPGDEVVTQPLTFVATCNAVAHQGASPVFVDVDPNTLGMSPQALSTFLEAHGERTGGGVVNRRTGRRIAAVMPMHVFGLPLLIEEIAEICAEWNIPLVEDSAESIGSRVNDRHTGRAGLVGAFSFNGNKTVTSGGGGCIVTDDPEIGRRAKHLTTTAKRPHKWEFYHDEVAWNYRMPNLNAALACAQLEQLDYFLADKRETATFYAEAMRRLNVPFVTERPGTRANYWLNAIMLADRRERDAFLELSNGQDVMTRPVWVLMHKLPAFASAFRDPLPNAEFLEDRLVNLPSSVVAG